MTRNNAVLAKLRQIALAHGITIERIECFTATKGFYFESGGIPRIVLGAKNTVGDDIQTIADGVIRYQYGYMRRFRAGHRPIDVNELEDMDKEAARLRDELIGQVKEG